MKISEEMKIKTVVVFDVYDGVVRVETVDVTVRHFCLIFSVLSVL